MLILDPSCIDLTYASVLEASPRADQPVHANAVAPSAAATDNRYSPRDRSGRENLSAG
jgi:hypothetical protein